MTRVSLRDLGWRNWQWCAGRASGHGQPQAQQAAAEAAAETGFIALFDGKSLAGWEGDPKSFRVEDGAIVGRHAESTDSRVTNFSSTEKEYGDFELRLQFKIWWAKRPTPACRFAVGGSRTTMK